MIEWGLADPMPLLYRKGCFTCQYLGRIEYSPGSPCLYGGLEMVSSWESTKYSAAYLREEFLVPEVPKATYSWLNDPGRMKLPAHIIVYR